MAARPACQSSAGGQVVCCLRIDDQPARTLKVGDTFYEPTGCLHQVSRNAGQAKARVLAVLLVPQDAKELSIPETPRDEGEKAVSTQALLSQLPQTRHRGRAAPRRLKVGSLEAPFCLTWPTGERKMDWSAGLPQRLDSGPSPGRPC